MWWTGLGHINDLIDREIYGQGSVGEECGSMMASFFGENTYDLKFLPLEMVAYMCEFFPRTWGKFDINNSGEIDNTESHTFMRSLMGRLNQFVLAPGSLTDISV